MYLILVSHTQDEAVTPAHMASEMDRIENPQVKLSSLIWCRCYDPPKGIAMAMPTIARPIKAATLPVVARPPPKPAA
jgi:hypothetical protein